MKWRRFEAVSGEELDRAKVFWKYYVVPDLEVFLETGNAEITRSVFIVESYGTDIRVYTDGQEIAAVDAAILSFFVSAPRYIIPHYDRRKY